MSKIINFNQATYINTRLQQEGIDCKLHLHAGCAYCVPELVCAEDVDLDRVYEIMNEMLKDSFMKVKPDTLNPRNVVVY